MQIFVKLTVLKNQSIQAFPMAFQVDLSLMQDNLLPYYNS